MQALIELIFVAIYILHFPAFYIAYFNHYLARFIPGGYKTEILTTWLTYLLIFLAIMFKRPMSPRKRLFFAFFFLAYILLMIVAVEKYIASPLNLTQPIPNIPMN